jgi:nicotinamidase-related amidase
MTVERTALLVMDVQQAIVDRTIKDPDYLTRLSGAIDRARRADIRVVYVRVGFRPDHPELSPRNRIFANMTHLDQFDESSPTTQIVPAIAPQSGDIIVTKRRVSAFTGSDLEVVLRANDVSTLVLAGIATSGVVLSTLRDAADRDFRLVVLSDCCADSDLEVHHVLMAKIFPRQAEILTAAEWPDR